MVVLCAGVHAQTIDDALAGCPSPPEVASIDGKLTLTFEYDSTAPALVCTAAGGGSVDLTEMKRRVYKLLLAIPQLTSFDAPLPWTGATYTDWLYNFSNLKGIRFRQDIAAPFCCDPIGVINLTTGSQLPGIDNFRDALPVWADPARGGYGTSLFGAITHEARHINFGGHGCGDNDNLLDEQGGWGTQYSASLWLADHGDPNFFRPKNPPPGTSGNDYYRDWERFVAEVIREVRICRDKRVIATVPVVEYFNTLLGHYFMTAEPAEMQAIAQGAAGPGWTVTGQSFNAYRSSDEARVDARPVCRFYGTPGVGPNSHFHTSDAAECAAVKFDPGWKFEGIAFYAVGAGAGGCPFSNLDGRPLPAVYRLYNNRFAFNDSNHRFTRDLTVYSEMQLQPWVGEGRVFCAAP